jgi:hypothetical protein
MGCVGRDRSRGKDRGRRSEVREQKLEIGIKIEVRDQRAEIGIQIEVGDGQGKRDTVC